MWQLGLRPRNSFSGNTSIQISLQCIVLYVVLQTRREGTFFARAQKCENGLVLYDGACVKISPSRTCMDGVKRVVRNPFTGRCIRLPVFPQSQIERGYNVYTAFIKSEMFLSLGPLIAKSLIAVGESWQLAD